MSYNQTMSTNQPGYIIFTVDQSSSMADSFYRGGGSKAEETAKAVNYSLREIILKCRRAEIIRDRCCISILAYRGSDEVVDLIEQIIPGQKIAKISELNDCVLRVETLKVRVPNGAGGLVEYEDQFPVWIDPVATGGTPMGQAFVRAKAYAEIWAQKYVENHPPVIINITDGEPNDEQLARDKAMELMQVATTDGTALLFNIHISSEGEKPIIFPVNPDGLPNLYAQFLYEISSELPASCVNQARAQRVPVSEGAKAFTFNADYELMVLALQIMSPINQVVSYAPELR